MLRIMNDDQKSRIVASIGYLKTDIQCFQDADKWDESAIDKLLKCCDKLVTGIKLVGTEGKYSFAPKVVVKPDLSYKRKLQKILSTYPGDEETGVPAYPKSLNASTEYSDQRKAEGIEQELNSRIGHAVNDREKYRDINKIKLLTSRLTELWDKHYFDIQKYDPQQHEVIMKLLMSENIPLKTKTGEPDLNEFGVQKIKQKLGLIDVLKDMEFTSDTKKIKAEFIKKLISLEWALVTPRYKKKRGYELKKQKEKNELIIAEIKKSTHYQQYEKDKLQQLNSKTKPKKSKKTSSIRLKINDYNTKYESTEEKFTTNNVVSNSLGSNRFNFSNQM